MRAHRLAAAGALLSAVSADPPPAGPGERWVVTLHEPFDGSELNASLWTKGWSWYDGKGNPQPRVQTKASDLCWFGDDNVAVSDGALVLTNRRERSHGFNYTSGVVNSIAYPPGSGRGFEQGYGYFEARVKPSPGQHARGMCPAFWMPNVKNAGDNGDNEIDVMEIPGGAPFGAGHTVWGTVHSRNEVNGAFHGNVSLPGYWSDDFHDFALLWEPDRLTWFADGRPFFSTTHLVPSTPAYLVLDNEIGLGYKAGPKNWWAGDPAGTPFPQSMLVDHVKVWAMVKA